MQLLCAFLKFQLFMSDMYEAKTVVCVPTLKKNIN